VTFLRDQPEVGSEAGLIRDSINCIKKQSGCRQGIIISSLLQAHFLHQVEAPTHFTQARGIKQAQKVMGLRHYTGLAKSKGAQVVRSLRCRKSLKYPTHIRRLEIVELGIHLQIFTAQYSYQQARNLQSNTAHTPTKVLICQIIRLFSLT
jgi:hypothetical protein